MDSTSLKSKALRYFLDFLSIKINYYIIDILKMKCNKWNYFGSELDINNKIGVGIGIVR